MVSGVDWAGEPKPADLDPAERQRRGYRMSADVAERLASLPGCRTLRCGMGIAIWTGPDRYVHRPPDYMIWTEDTTDQHLHQIVRTGIWREIQDEAGPEEIPEETPMTRALGHRQRLMMSSLADRGAWWPGCGWGHGTDTATEHLLRSLRYHGLITQDGFGLRSGLVWHLTGHGYQWLIDAAKADRDSLAPDPEHLPGESRPTTRERLDDRIAHLTRLSELGRVSPVNWRGERV